MYRKNIIQAPFSSQFHRRQFILKKIFAQQIAFTLWNTPRQKSTWISHRWHFLNGNKIWCFSIVFTSFMLFFVPNKANNNNKITLFRCAFTHHTKEMCIFYYGFVVVVIIDIVLKKSDKGGYITHCLFPFIICFIICIHTSLSSDEAQMMLNLHNLDKMSE